MCNALPIEYTPQPEQLAVYRECFAYVDDLDYSSHVMGKVHYCINGQPVTEAEYKVAFLRIYGREYGA